MSKPFVALVVSGLLALGCQRSEQRGQSSGQPAFRVALLTPGPISDQSWNAGAYAGLLRIRDSLGASVSNIETKTPAEFEENFEQYGAQGYDLVFGHGFEFQDAAKRVAPAHRSTTYVITSGNSAAGNVASLVFGFSGASYVAGMLAGGLTKTNVIATLGGTELPPVKESFEAFAAGARAVNPKARVLTSYIGNWDDVSAGKEQALAQLSRGADIIFQNADAAGLGVFQAIREHPGALIIGSNSNQNSLAPDATIGSVVIDLPHAMLTVAREVKERRFRPGVITLGGASEVVTFVANPTFAGRIPAPLKQRADSIQTLIRNGSFVLPGVAPETVAP